MAKTSDEVGRSREGAWIEIDNSAILDYIMNNVAPARERGLKCYTP